MSIEVKYSFLESAYPDLLKDIGMLIQKAKISNRFKSVVLVDSENATLEKAKSLCELRIIELWNDQSSEEFKALCSTYFDIASQLEVDLSSEFAVFEYIKIITCGYLGESWHLVKQYLKGQNTEIENLEITDQWNSRLLTNSFKALIGLIRKNNWKDIDASIKYIGQLREEQKQFEDTFLTKVEEDSQPYGAAELVSLYHFAKSVEILGQYLLNGRPNEVENLTRYHVDYAHEYAQKSGNISLELLFQFFQSLSIKLIRNTIWYSTLGINNWVTLFNKFISENDDRGVFELLYPQRSSILDGELLNPAHRAIVINLPTSSGKTMIAEYRILMAMNQFKDQNGWVAYVVPTKALVNQIYIQLKKELGTIGLKVEKVSGAVELDGFEEALFENDSRTPQFDVLVTTYEKLNLLVRQGHGASADRALVLTVVDEAHNIEEEERGLNLEFLLSTIKNDCEQANFLLMTPDVSNAKEITEWLAGDRGKEINLNLHWWQPNERIVGALEMEGRARNYKINLKTLSTLKGTYKVGSDIEIVNIENGEKTKSSFSKVQFTSLVSGRILDTKNPIIVLARNPGETYKIANSLESTITDVFETDEEIELIKRYIEAEMGQDFPLIRYLSKRIAVHSSALPDEIRILIEDLMSKEKLQVLVATTTIAQGINFPVSAVVMGSYSYSTIRGTKEMPVRDFWNLAGRVGRAGQQEMGWIGIASNDKEDLLEIGRYVQKASDELHSQLVKIIDTALQHADQDFNKWLYYDARWSSILQFISHLYKQNRQLESFLSQLEQKLQGTLGYRQLNANQKAFFREKIRGYAQTITGRDSEWSDSTGFSTISVNQMIGKLSGAGLTSNDWTKRQLFSEQNQSLQKLVGIMLSTYEIMGSMKDLTSSDQPVDRARIARLIIDWVDGKDIKTISQRFYQEEDQARAIELTTKALYKVIANVGTWGLAALQKMPTSGVNWDKLSETEKKRMANIPAYLHYGVNTDEGVLMRKNNIPRSIANKIGELYNASVRGEIFGRGSSEVDNWLGKLDTGTWHSVRPSNSKMSGADYKRIWEKLSGLN